MMQPGAVPSHGRRFHRDAPLARRPDPQPRTLPESLAYRFFVGQNQQFGHFPLEIAASAAKLPPKSWLI
jgi:hypothetical protein